MTRTLRVSLTPVQSIAATASAERQHLRWRKTWISLLTFFLMLSLAILWSVSAAGQQPKYDVLPVEAAIDQNLDAVQREARAYSQAREISGMPANRVAVVERYFRQYVPAKITRPDATHQINDVMNHATSSMRAAIRMETPAARNLMRWLYAGLKPVAVGNYQPAARINAIHFISRLAKPAQRGSMPEPYPFVLTDMREIYDNTGNPDGVRAAALQGIERFVRYTPANKIAPADRQALGQAMAALLQSDVPKGRDQLAHAFLQRYAVSILTNLSTDASIGKQLVSVSTKETNPNLIALHSAAAVGTLPGKMAEGDVQTKDVLKQWARRVLAAYQNEIGRLNAMENKRKAVRQPPPPESFLKETRDPNEKPNPKMMGGMMDEMEGYGDEMMMEDEMMGMENEMMYGDTMGMESMMYGDMGGMMAMEKPQPAEIVASRKKLNYVLQQVLLGVTGNPQKVEDVESIKPKSGLMAATPADGLDSVKSWVQSVNDLTGNLNDKSIGTRIEFVKMLGEQLESLESLASGKKATVKQYEAPDFDGNFNELPGMDAEQPAAGQPAGGGAPAPQPAPAGDAGLEALMSQ